MKRVILKESSVPVPIHREVHDAVTKAESFQVTDSQSYQEASEFLLGLKALIRKAEEFSAPIKKKTREAWLQACEDEHKLIDPLEKAIAILEPKRHRYIDEMEKERKRIEEELQQKLREEALREQQHDAEVARALGDDAGAEQILAEEPEIKAPIVSSLIPKVEGIANRPIWKFSIFNDKLIPREFLTPDTERIGKYVRLMKGRAKIPGVRTWTERVTAGRTKGWR